MNHFNISSLMIVFCLSFGGSALAQESSPLIEASSSNTIQAQYDEALSLMQGWRLSEAEAILLAILEAAPGSDMENMASARLSDIARYREVSPEAERTGEPVPDLENGLLRENNSEINMKARRNGTMIGVGAGIPLGLFFGGSIGLGVARYRVSKYHTCEGTSGTFADCIGTGIVILFTYGAGLVVGGVVGAVSGGIGGGILGRHEGAKKPIEEDTQSLRLTPTLTFDKNKVPSYGLQASFRF